MSAEEKELIELAKELDAKDAAARRIAARIMAAQFRKPPTFFNKVWGGLKSCAKYVTLNVLPSVAAGVAGGAAVYYAQEHLSLDNKSTTQED